MRYKKVQKIPEISLCLHLQREYTSAWTILNALQNEEKYIKNSVHSFHKTNHFNLARIRIKINLTHTKCCYCEIRLRILKG
jgi:hypothetical protein